MPEVTRYDHGAIAIFRGVTGWCFIVTVGGIRSGQVGYGSHESALAAARRVLVQGVA